MFDLFCLIFAISDKFLTYLNSIFFTIFTQKSPFFVLKLSPSLFFLARNVIFFFFFLRIGQFLAFKLDVYQNFCRKKKTFFLFLSSAPACFFWPEKSYFLYSRSIVFFLLNCSFFVHLTQIFPNFLFLKTPFFLFKLSPSLFLFGPKSLLLFFLENCSIFCPYTSIFPQFLARKILLF